MIDDVDSMQFIIIVVLKEGEVMGIRYKRFKIEGV